MVMCSDDLIDMLMPLGVFKNGLVEKTPDDMNPVDMLYKIILMATTKASRSVPAALVCQAGASSRNLVLLSQLRNVGNKPFFHRYLNFSDDIRTDVYSDADFETRFKQRFAKELNKGKQDSKDY
ncbi:hypothetical protein BGX26_007465 [Mortierella sp. AD094]|nr:hypothetical protein BGX26_007465 [Mortierella sp. AD094]